MRIQGRISSCASCAQNTLAVLLVTVLCGSFVILAPSAAAQASGSVVISEIFYNAPGQDEGHEFVELYNPGSAAIDVSGWQLSDGISASIPAGISLAGGARFVITADAADFVTQFGFAAPLTYGRLTLQ